jgi:glycyl-tRNA synthetase
MKVSEKYRDSLPHLVSLCKRRGFIFQSSEIYGGLRSAYDFGPLGVELKRNIAQCWWNDMVHRRDDIVGIDASVIMHPKVWETSGHTVGFSDPLVDCLNCKERFRADKAPKVIPGTAVFFDERVISDGKITLKKSSAIAERDYVCPICGSPHLSSERQFNLMFRSNLGSVDPLEQVVNELSERSPSLPPLTKQELRSKLDEAIRKTAIYLRPETAQAMFVQFLNVYQSMSPKIPFGIAQIGRSFRNEIISERFIFRTVEFEQMELEYFVLPGTESEHLASWCSERINWWRKFANQGDNFRLRQHEKDELAHYSNDCYDIEYFFPWGWDELEGVASRTDYDLKNHTRESGVKLQVFDQNMVDPETGKPGFRFTPYVIEPAAGLTRGVLAFLADAYHEEEGIDADGIEKTRVVLKLHPKLAPIKVGVFPLTKKDGLPELARRITASLVEEGIYAKYDEQQSIGKRYAKHDEIGTPFGITVDNQSLSDNSVTIRYRDTTKQERVSTDGLLQFIEDKLR